MIGFKNNSWCFVLILLFSKASAFAGGRENGGGNWLATEFRDRARFIIFLLSEKNKSLLSVEQVQSFIASVADTRIELTKEELVDEFGGAAKAVTTDDPKRPGKKLIKVGEEDWQSLLTGDMPGNTINIVFHEYLRSIEIEDYNEFTSSQLRATEEHYLEWIKSNRRAEDNVISISYEISGDLIPKTSNQSEEEMSTRALASYARKAREWRASIEDSIRNEIGESIGIKGIYIDKSMGIQSENIEAPSATIMVTDLNIGDRQSTSANDLSRWLGYIKRQRSSSYRYPGQIGPGTISIGKIASYKESIQIHFEQNRTLLRSAGNRIATEIRYWKSDCKTERDCEDHYRIVYDLMQADFVIKCAAWKNSVREQLAETWSLVLLDCGIPRIVDNDDALGIGDLVEVESGTSTNRRVHHYFKLQGYQMVSRGTVYYFTK